MIVYDLAIWLMIVIGSPYSFNDIILLSFTQRVVSCIQNII